MVTVIFDRSTRAVLDDAPAGVMWPAADPSGGCAVTDGVPECAGRASAVSPPHAASANGTTTSAVHESRRIRMLRSMLYMVSSSVGRLGAVSES
ncbi:MAG TPA: hypothetical protein VNE60_06025 [Gemmatimonadaceae bacterium]|nr:hypothetical protein [Gemmatimonadaceae bacterium]